jgi:hypothetical protein
MSITIACSIFLRFLVGLAVGLSYNNKAMKSEIALRKKWEEAAIMLQKQVNDLIKSYKNYPH